VGALGRGALEALRRSHERMNWLNTILVLIAAFLAVFLEATVNGLRHLFGVQVDLLPSLVVYASLSTGLVTVALLSVCGGLWFDALSANPLGISVLPLFLIGFVIHSYRGLILREQAFAQLVLGLAAGAGAPVLTLLLLLNTDTQPLLGWFSLWQWLVMSLLGAAVTPLWFRFFDRLSQALSYKPLGETSFRPDRQIKRGRM
jgi:cell shape-determining protein MreD